MILPAATKRNFLFQDAHQEKMREGKTSVEAFAEIYQMPESSIRNCDMHLRNGSPICGHACPFLWENLDLTETSSVRHCQVCHQQVFLCKSRAEALAHGAQGHFVAMRGPGYHLEHIFELGPFRGTPEQKAAFDINREDAHIKKALREFRYCTRSCPECGALCPDAIDRCYACAHAMEIIKK
jgi:hypothetical protein